MLTCTSDRFSPRFITNVKNSVLTCLPIHFMKSSFTRDKHFLWHIINMKLFLLSYTTNGVWHIITIYYRIGQESPYNIFEGPLGIQFNNF